MNQKELMKILEIDSWKQIQYYEQFLTLMDYYNEIDHEILINVFSSIPLDDRVAFIEYYFDDLMTGVPDDEMSLYKIFSSTKSILMDIAAISDKRFSVLDRLVDEFLRFVRWITEDVFISYSDLKDHSVKEVSIYEALILSRIELLNEGKYKIEFPDDLHFEIEAFDDYNDSHVNYHEEAYDYEDESDITLVDPENPVIVEFE